MSGVPCKHWSECGLPSGGCCAKGLYGGRPSAGICLRHCDDYEGPPRGAGDVLATVTKLTGIQAVTKAASKLTGKPCGCAKRRRKMNAAMPTERGRGGQISGEHAP